MSDTNKLYHFYHIYADGNWKEPTMEHLKALKDSGLYDELNEISIGIVGSLININTVAEYLTRFDKVHIKTFQSEGWEQVTQRLIKDISHLDGKVLYAHTKGAWNNTEVNPNWRREMTKYNVTEWRTCIEDLNTFDCVGIHWMYPVNLPDGTPFFAGNFWWANLYHIRKLDYPKLNHRYQAEEWLGSNHCTIKSYKLGHP